MKKTLSALLALVIAFTMISVCFHSLSAGAITTYYMDVGQTKTLHLETNKTLHNASWVSNTSAVSVSGNFTYGTVKVLSYSSLTAIITCNYYYWQVNQLTGARYLLSGAESYYIKINKPESLTISFSSSNPYVSIPSQTVEYGEAIGTLPTPYAYGYTFLGWYTASSGGTRIYSDTKFTESATLYAHWSQDTSPTTPSPATQAPDPSDVVYQYKVLDDGTAEIIGCSGSPAILDIPSEIDGYTVTSIGSSAFYRYTSLTSVTFPDTVKKIGSNAFYFCYQLTTLILPPQLEIIGYQAFYDCRNVTGNILIPDTVTSIGSGAFRGCEKITKINIPDGISAIGDYTFDGCNRLEDISLPDSVRSIGNSAFKSCWKLKTIHIPENVTSIGEFAFDYCTALTSILLPDSVTKIQKRAFYCCSKVSEITIPSSVKTIGENALGYYYENGEYYNKVKGFTIYGYEGTAAQTYADENGFLFVNLNALPTEPETQPQTETPTFSEKTADVTIYDICGNSTTTVFHVGESFTVYTVLNTSGSAGSGEIVSIQAAQEFTDDVLKPLDKVDEDGIVTDLPYMFPILQNNTLARLVGNSYVYSAVASSSFLFDNDNAVLIRSSYTVQNEGNAEIRNTIKKLYAADEALTDLSDSDHIKDVVGTMSFIAPDVQDHLLPGDADNDWEISILDATVIQKYLAKIYVHNPAIVQFCGDISNDRLNITDVSYLQKYLALLPIPYHIKERLP